MWLDIGLVPFADLLQHSNESQIILSHENGLSFMNSVGIVESGQEIYDNYATNDDINLFVTFGFVDKSSISNLLINFIFDKKEGILKDIVELRSGDNKNLHISSSGISERLMKFIRVNMINSDDLKLIDFNSNNLGEDIISLSNELRSLKKIKNRMDFFIEKSEIEYVRGNYNNHQTDTLESEICELIIKIDNLKIQVNQFINTYWINLLR
jgi:uncharacterized protein YpiB (UPF0302 family)